MTPHRDPSRRSRALHALDRGDTVAQVAARFGVAVRTVQMWSASAARAGLRPLPLDDATKAELYRRFRAGEATPAQLAEETGYQRSSIVRMFFTLARQMETPPSGTLPRPRRNDDARGLDPRATSDRDASTLTGGERHGLERE